MQCKIHISFLDILTEVSVKCIPNNLFTNNLFTVLVYFISFRNCPQFATVHTYLTEKEDCVEVVNQRCQICFMPVSYGVEGRVSIISALL